MTNQTCLCRHCTRVYQQPILLEAALQPKQTWKMCDWIGNCPHSRPQPSGPTNSNDVSKHTTKSQWEWKKTHFKTLTQPSTPPKIIRSKVWILGLCLHFLVASICKIFQWISPVSDFRFNQKVFAQLKVVVNLQHVHSQNSCPMLSGYLLRKDYIMFHCPRLLHTTTEHCYPLVGHY